jgi:poly-gamma-glutamate synthesis protein (capsule biosynthesis protein)
MAERNPSGGVLDPTPAGPVVRAVGDIAIIGHAAAALDRYGSHYPFERVADLIKSADLAFGNLEMPILPDGQHEPYFPDVCPDFHCPSLTAEALKVAGFDVLNLANNHMMDWGLAGLQETRARLDQAGLRAIGAGETLHDARKPAILVRRGLRIAFLGYGVPGPWNATSTRPGVAPIDRDMILEDMRAIRDEVDLLIVSLHTGLPSGYPNTEDRDLKRELVDYGADLILGHGPHVLQGIELYRDRVIAHSLGNFIIDLSSGNIKEEARFLQPQRESIILSVTLATNGTPEVNCDPVIISDTYQTVPADPQDAAHILAHLETLSNNLDHMRGLALWEHAGARNVEHELKVLTFQAREVGWRHALKRLTKIRWRHLRLLLGYLVAKTKQMLGRR